MMASLSNGIVIFFTVISLLQHTLTLNTFDKSVRNVRQRNQVNKRPHNVDHFTTSIRPSYLSEFEQESKRTKNEEQFTTTKPNYSVEVDSIEGGNQWKPLFNIPVEPDLPSTTKFRKHLRQPQQYSQNLIHTTEQNPLRSRTHESKDYITNQPHVINDYIKAEKLIAHKPKGKQQQNHSRTKSSQYEVYEFVNEDTNGYNMNSKRYRYQEIPIGKTGKGTRKNNGLEKHIHHYYYHDQMPPRKNRQSSRTNSVRNGRPPISRNSYY